MSNQIVVNQPGDVHNQPDMQPIDSRDMNRMEQHNDHHARRGSRSRWVGGLVLIFMGSVFMLQNAGILRPLVNWWAMFLLFPAIGAFAAGVAIYQRRDSWAAAAVPFTGGLLILSLAVAFLLDINLTLFWPFLLIASGLAIVVFSALARSR